MFVFMRSGNVSVRGFGVGLFLVADKLIKDESFDGRINDRKREDMTYPSLRLMV